MRKLKGSSQPWTKKLKQAFHGRPLKNNNRDKIEDFHTFINLDISFIIIIIVVVVIIISSAVDKNKQFYL